jgi:hypothetical protein
METNAVILQLEKRVMDLEAQFRLLENARTRDNRNIAEGLVMLLSIIYGIAGADAMADELEALANDKRATDDQISEGIANAIASLHFMRKDGDK